MLKLYIDENLSPAIAEQLRGRGVDAISVRDMGLLGDTDVNHLRRAVALGRTLVTSDADFFSLLGEVSEHTGIIYGAQRRHSVGDWVTKLELISFVYSEEEMRNRIEYL